MNIKETAQKIVDIFFEAGARVSKKHYDEVVKILERVLMDEKVNMAKSVIEEIKKSKCEYVSLDDLWDILFSQAGKIKKT